MCKGTVFTSVNISKKAFLNYLFIFTDNFTDMNSLLLQ